MSKYLKLDLEAIRRDFPQVWAWFEKEFEVTPRIGTIYDHGPVGLGQYTIAGDGSSFHFLLTKK